MTTNRKTISSSVRGALELLGLTVLADIFGLTHVDENELNRIREEGQNVTFIAGNGESMDISHLHPGKSANSKES